MFVKNGTSGNGILTAKPETPGDSIERYPRVCIVVVTYLVGHILRNVLGAISELDYPKEKMRLILVASPEDNNARECFNWFKASQDRLEADFLVISINSADLKRNEGIRASECEYVLVMDDDVLINSLILSHLLELVQLDELTAAVASPAIDDAPTLAGRLHFGRFDGRIAGAYTVMPCTLFRRSLVTRCGLYREDMGPPFTIHEDWELGSRLRREGFKVLVDGRVMSKHLHQLSGRKPSAVPKSGGSAQSQARGSGHHRIRKYVSEYLHKNWWSMWQVMKVSPIAQTLEYVGYALVPALLLLLVILDFGLGLLSVALSLAAISLYALAKGYYRTYAMKRRISYPLILTWIRVFRTYLLILGLVVNSRHLDKRP